MRETGKNMQTEELKFANGKYQPIKNLYNTGYEQAWLVRETISIEEKLLVLKFLEDPESSRGGHALKQQYIDEINLFKKLRHPSVIRLIGTGTCAVGDYDSVYYVTEYDDLPPLSSLLSNSDLGVTLDDVYALMESMLKALLYCQEHNVLHLDINPDNVLVKLDESKRISDCILVNFGKIKRMALPYAHGGVGNEYIHPDLALCIKQKELDYTIFNDSDAQRFDLYSCAVVIEKLLKNVTKVGSSSDSNYNYIMSIMSELKNLENKSLFTTGKAIEVLNRNKDYKNDVKLHKIRISATKTASLTKDLLNITNTRSFQRLRDVKQLGLTCYVYPSATHTRLSHSIGTYARCDQYITALYNSDTFRFRYSRDQLDVVRLYALLHDIGHFPFAHYLEELGLRKIKVDHSYFTKRILKGEIGKTDDIASMISATLGSTPDDVYNLLEKEKLLSSIVDSPIDCDKLDYLIRDGLTCGVPYADNIDVDRFLSSLTCVENSSQEWVIGVESKGVAAVETILLARYHLFSEVYWHKSCRAIIAMIKEAFYLLIRLDKVSQHELDEAVMKFGDNDFLNWLYEKLSGVDSEAAKSLICDSFLDYNSKIYKRLVTYADVWDNPDTEMTAYKVLCSLHDYGDAYELKKHLVNHLNETGKGTRGWLILKDHDILIDIPPANKDVQRGIYVRYYDDSLHKNFYNMQQVSSFLKAMGESYLEKRKKIRLFVNPHKIEQITALTNTRDDFKKIIADGILKYK